jgi:branched-chain amino acid transport system permease protein
LQRQDIAIIVVTVIVMVALTLFFALTRTGKALRATSQNPRAAALIGIPVKSMRMIAWGLAAGLAGIGGILLSPKLLMTPDMGNVVMLAFAAAIIGGFSSLIGCVVGGIILGVMQNFVGVFISPQAMSVTPFVVIMLILVLRPQGLFGELALKKV